MISRNKRFAEQCKADVARWRERQKRLWEVKLNEPLERVFCDGLRQTSAAYAVFLYENWLQQIHVRTLPTDRQGCVCIYLEPQPWYLTVEESFMEGFIGSLRLTGAHGYYFHSQRHDEQWQF